MAHKKRQKRRTTQPARQQAVGPYSTNAGTARPAPSQCQISAAPHLQRVCKHEALRHEGLRQLDHNLQQVGDACRAQMVVRQAGRQAQGEVGGSADGGSRQRHATQSSSMLHFPCWLQHSTHLPRPPRPSPSPVMAEVGTMFMKERGSLFFQYSATFSPCSFSWSATCRAAGAMHAQGSQSARSAVARCWEEAAPLMAPPLPPLMAEGHI